MNLGDLRTHFKNLLNRSDVTDALANTFIEQGISRIQRQLRTPMTENLTNYTISGQTASVDLPTDFIEIISLYYDTTELRRVPMAKYRTVAPSAVAGNPVMFTREQSRLKLHPQPTSGTLVLYYYGEFEAMTADSDENVLAQVAPDLIVYAALTYAADWFLDERAELFENKFNQFILEVQEQANDQEMNGGVQSIQPADSFNDKADTYTIN